MSRRRLSDEEHALWSGVARGIAPLRKSRKTAKASLKEHPVEQAFAQKPATPSREPSKRQSAPLPRETPPPAKQTPLAPFGRKMKQRVARGREPIDKRIDLHGLTQAEAHDALLRFLRHAQADGAKLALVVTGKGSGRAGHGPAFGSEPGVLRRQVPLWLALAEFRPLIVGFEDAHVSHGGSGALYVRLRRQR
jgi:DNA-nicking Smr family endonuclease